MDKPPVFHRLCSAVSQARLFQPEDRILLAFSGGPDSTALLEILSAMTPRQGWKLHAFHLNHCLRGQASDREETFVRRWVKHKKIPLICRRVNVRRYCQCHHLGLEEGARKIRYQLLEKAATRIRADKIALAHTADDQAETLLWRLLRGSVMGLAGMPSRRQGERTKIPVMRPFLSVRKRDILAFLRQANIPYCTDTSNRNKAYTRNRIRHQLIPFLQKNFNPRLVDILNCSAQALREQRDFVEDATQKTLHKGILRIKKNEVTLDVSAIRRCPAAVVAEIFKRAVESCGGDLGALHNQHIAALRGLLNPLPTSKQVILGPIRARREQKVIVFSRTDRIPQNLGKRRLKVPGKTSWPGGTITLSEQKWRNGKPPWKAPGRRSPTQPVEYLDRETLVLPLTVRSRQPGDRFRPLGLKGTKKIKSVLAELKIPLSQRDWLPLVVDAKGRIVWVGGYRIADFCKVRPDSRSLLRLQYERRGE